MSNQKFTDIHCHGGGGYSFSDPNPENILTAITTHKSHGTETLIASLVTEPIETLEGQIKKLIPFVEEGHLAGIHLEGPYLSHAKCGAHDPSLLRQPHKEEIKRLLDVGSGHIKMITIAPELPGAIESIAVMRESGVVAALGHSNATFDEARAGIDAGANLVTHMFNGLPELDHRNANILNAVLTDPNIHFEVILDGTHVNRSAMQLLISIAKERIILITDAMSAAGSKDGNYKIGQLDVSVNQGIATLTSNGSLAGSTLTMDEAFHRLINDHRFTESEALEATSQRAKKLLNLK